MIDSPLIAWISARYKILRKLFFIEWRLIHLSGASNHVGFDGYMYIGGNHACSYISNVCSYLVLVGSSKEKSS